MVTVHQLSWRHGRRKHLIDMEGSVTLHVCSLCYPLCGLEPIHLPFVRQLCFALSAEVVGFLGFGVTWVLTINRDVVRKPKRLELTARRAFEEELFHCTVSVLLVDSELWQG